MHWSIQKPSSSISTLIFDLAMPLAIASMKIENICHCGGSSSSGLVLVAALNLVGRHTSIVGHF